MTDGRPTDGRPTGQAADPDDVLEAVARAEEVVRRGDLEDAARLARAAHVLARRVGDPGLLAAVALALEPLGHPTWDGTVYQRCAEALAVDALDEPTQVRLLARQTQAAAYLGLSDEAARTSAEALRRAESLHDPEALVAALTARQLATSGPEHLDELERLAERMVALGARAGRPEVEMRGRLWQVDTHWYRGRLAGIAAETSRMQRCVDAQDGPSARWHLLTTRAFLALARAEFEEARALQTEASAVFERIGHPAVHGAEVSFRLLSGHHRGHPEGDLEAQAWRFGTDNRWDLYARLGRAFALADSGRLDEAAAAYRRCGFPGTWAVPPAGRLVGLGVGARVAAALGVLDEAALLRDRLLPHRDLYVAGGAGAGGFLGPVTLALGVCAAALGLTDLAREELADASTRCRRIGAPGFLVESDCLLAEVLLQGGEQASAYRLARETVALARVLGMTPWVRRLEALLASDDGPLSPREREVAGLVAQGLGNRAIAERLVISERTAQNHVQHILAKLGFTSRAQIAAWASRRAG